MPSSAEPDEAKLARRAFAGRIAHLVLPDEGGLDRRDALLLIDCDVIRPEPSTHSKGEVASLHDAVRNKKDKASPGPVLVYAGEDLGHAAVRVRDLLLDERHEVRQIGVDHLEDAARSDDLTCIKTRSMLEQLKTGILSDDETIWRRSSIKMAEAVDDDWLLNVAGVGQCRRLDIRGLWAEYIKSVLRPSATVVNACSPPLLCPGVHADELEGQVARLTSEAQSVSQLCCRFFETIGHIPVGGRVSLGSVLSRYRRDLSPGDRGEVIDWAMGSSHPIARYHACETVISGIADLTPPQRDRVSTWFWELILRPGSVEPPTPGQIVWDVAARCVRYYLRYLELRMPSDHGEAIAAMSWWMTSRLLGAITGSASDWLGFVEQLEGIYGSSTAAIWDLVEPPMVPSTLRWLTAFGPSPWALSLMSAIDGPEVVERLFAGAGPGDRLSRLSALVATAMQVANLSLEESGYRYSADARRVLGWAASSELEEAERVVLNGWANGVDWSLDDALSLAFYGLEEKSEAVQQWICHGIRQRVATGDLNAEELWNAVTGHQWKEEKWLRIDAVAVQALGGALIDAANRRNPRWRAHVPHLFAEIAEQRVESESEREAMFAVVLKASCALNASSALSRLLRGQKGHRYRALSTAVRGNIERVLPDAGGWAAGRLRSVLVDLLQ